MEGLLEDAQKTLNDLWEAYRAGNSEDIASLAEELRAIGTEIIRST